MLTLYGHPFSRAHRVMWMLGEQGLAYEHIPTGFQDGGGGGGDGGGRGLPSGAMSDPLEDVEQLRATSA